MSDRDLMERQHKRELRGSILRTLAEAFGTTTDVSVAMLRRVRPDAAARDLETELAYLEGLGYALRCQDKRDALDVNAPVYWRLLAKGMQVINGDLEDRSIEL